ncbi:STAS-like domain-containing protein [Aquipuribacter hungaricus]|uniref:STAS-like domain-containing protein n=1 Tax=Aquipuribacter hungaricus TaxID=545624 RepID=A0ABV7WGB5_9MICO
MSRLVRVGEVARELGVTPARLRQLADSGVVPSERSPGGHRVFDPGAVRSALARRSSSDFTQPRWTEPTWERLLPLAGLQEDAVWRDVVVDVLQDRLSPEGRSTAGYAFTEMLNNAIDHSGAADVRVAVWASRLEIRFEVSDDGRGALHHLQQRLGLEDAYDALGELTKGKTTTDPEHHSGEGIFFTSKAVDVFTLESAGLRWTVDNVRQDQAVGASDIDVGTRVRWEMDPATTTPIADVFGAYTDEDHQFSRTRTVVRLFGIGVRFVSRSEAKRLMRGLDRFKEVTLDFTGVEEVGQGFVDEVLRVWPRKHEGTLVTPVGMTGPVEFMVRRGLPSAAQPSGTGDA